MIPTKSGEFELPAVKFLYFDPKKKSYESAEVKPPKIVVSKQTSGLALPATPASSATSTSAPTKKLGKPLRVKWHNLWRMGSLHCRENQWRVRAWA